MPRVARKMAASGEAAEAHEAYGRAMATEQASETRAMWALGDYHRFAKATVWETGPVLVEACGVSPDDVAEKLAAREGTSGIDEKASRNP